MGVVRLGARERTLLVEGRAGGAGEGGGKRRRLLTPQLARDKGSKGGGDEAGERSDRDRPAACDRKGNHWVRTSINRHLVCECMGMGYCYFLPVRLLREVPGMVRAIGWSWVVWC